MGREHIIGFGPVSPLYIYSYTNQRLILFRKLCKYHPLNLNLLLVGSDNLSLNDNIEIVYSVQELIKNSGRFE